MTRRLATIFLAVLAPLGLAGVAPAEQTTPPEAAEAAAAPTSPRWLDRLRYNPKERTDRGLAELEASHAESAAAELETAGRLEPQDPVVRYNAGTGHLFAQNEAAIPHLEAATEKAPAELAPVAHFNLGNARLAAGEPEAAIEAYKNALRANPGLLEAKHNLEIARRLLQEQQQQQQEQSQDQSEDEERENESEDQEQNDGEQEEEQENPDDQGQEGDEEEEQSESELPDFAEQPEMTAEQAAAILEAVENLEREQRRQQAAEQARQAAKTGKDW